MLRVVFVMLFAVVLPSKGGICEVDAHLLPNINALVPLHGVCVRETHIGIIVQRHCPSDHLMARLHG